eukprot:11497600-Heterocapsa_arctica.AAC.1
MSEREVIKVLQWLFNNRAMKEAAEKWFDPECLEQNRKINPQCHILRTTIFDQLIGAPRAIRENKEVFNMGDYSMEKRVP